MDSGLLSLIPLNSKSLFKNLIADECVNINVVEPRKSKYGDFRFKINNTPSININRNVPLFDEITDHRIENTNKKTLLIINNLTATRRKILKIDTARTL